MALSGFGRLISWCRERAMLLVGAALYISGLFLFGAAFAMPWIRVALPVAGIVAVAAGFVLARPWWGPTVERALPTPGKGPAGLFSGGFFGFFGLFCGGFMAGIGGLLGTPDLGALGLGMSLAGFLLAMLSESLSPQAIRAIPPSPESSPVPPHP